MEPVTEKVATVFKPVYISHHAVIRESNSTTKLRLVFNASCKTRNGTSLNDHLLVEPKVQQDLPAIIVRWHQSHYMYTADMFVADMHVAKMFRQILTESGNADFQRILWRPNPESSLNISTSYSYIRTSL
ncbi:hypothetical protein HN011_003595 [Eciton burchellii]|nr:hypothetical protein HN011_003595 [Eciton burchellii]